MRTPEQQSLDLQTVYDHIEIVYAALRRAVDEGFESISEFADALGKTRPEVSLRLRRAPDGKGYHQFAYLDYLGFLNPVARHAFLCELMVAWGYRPPELAREATPDEKRRILAGGLTDEVKRDLEKRNGLRKGELDR